MDLGSIPSISTKQQSLSIDSPVLTATCPSPQSGLGHVVFQSVFTRQQNHRLRHQ